MQHLVHGIGIVHVQLVAGGIGLHDVFEQKIDIAECVACVLIEGMRQRVRDLPRIAQLALARVDQVETAISKQADRNRHGKGDQRKLDTLSRAEIGIGDAAEPGH